MDDANLRGELLEVFYSLRHNAGGWVPASDMNVKNGAASLQVVGTVCQQLADAGLIEWRALMDDEGLAAGMARITGHGVDVVNGSRASSLDIRFPSSAHADLQLLAETSSQQPTPEFVGSADEILTLKPSLWGVSIDLKALWRWLRRRRSS